MWYSSLGHLYLFIAVRKIKMKWNIHGITSILYMNSVMNIKPIILYGILPSSSVIIVADSSHGFSPIEVLISSGTSLHIGQSRLRGRSQAVSLIKIASILFKNLTTIHFNTIHTIHINLSITINYEVHWFGIPLKSDSLWQEFIRFVGAMALFWWCNCYTNLKTNTA